MSWDQYYQLQQGRAVRPLLTRVMALMSEGNPVQPKGLAIDLGCGAGFETCELLTRGWRVLAIDRERSAIERLSARLSKDFEVRLTTLCTGFEAVPAPGDDRPPGRGLVLDLQKTQVTSGKFAIFESLGIG